MISTALIMILTLSTILSSGSFRMQSFSRKSYSTRDIILFAEEEEPSAPPPSAYERNKDGSYTDKRDVKDTLSQLMAGEG
jgi:hypothetical protein